MRNSWKCDCPVVTCTFFFRLLCLKINKCVLSPAASASLIFFFYHFFFTSVLFFGCFLYSFSPPLALFLLFICDCSRCYVPHSWVSRCQELQAWRWIQHRVYGIMRYWPQCSPPLPLSLPDPRWGPSPLLEWWEFFFSRRCFLCQVMSSLIAFL